MAEANPQTGKFPFKRKFKEGPFKGLCFRMRSDPNSGNEVVLEFYNRTITVSRPDYISWAEQDC